MFRLSSFVLAVGVLTGCGLLPGASQQDKIDYRGAQKGTALDIPPDLTAPRFDDRYRERAGVAGAGTPANAAASGSPVLPKVDKARIERNGSSRWLVVNEKAEVLWPTVRDFFVESGLPLVVDRPDTGIMETDWVENRARIEESFLRKTLRGAIDGLYSSGTRDKFRLRMERVADGTEIYLSHRGMEEMPIGGPAGTTATTFRWEMRPSDSELEAEMLNRLLIRIGFPQASARAVTASAAGVTNPSTAANARAAAQPSGDLFKADGSGRYITVNDDFDRAWRRVGLALDRVSFTVVDRDRSAGTYFVRFADGDQKKADEGFLERMKFWKGDEPPPAEQYRITVKGGSGSSEVRVLDKAGKEEKTVVGGRILNLIANQLK